ncbi:MAG: hypothetical protein AMXMBFR58_24530 [Phycisphaerae bacterium]
MLQGALDKLAADDILQLIRLEAREGRTLEFKREIHGKSEDDKTELRADATAFANVAGGDLVFGVDEREGVAVDVPGLDAASVDAEMRRIEETIQAGVAPRIPGLRLRAISMSGGRAVIVVRIPRSWKGPHLVRTGGSFKMFGRSSAKKTPFDEGEIRAAYEGAGEVVERIRRWREERVAQIANATGIIPLEGGPCIVLHIVPLAAPVQPGLLSAADLIALKEQFRPIGGGGNDSRINLDGAMTFERGVTGMYKSYCQVFRSGAVESTATGIASESSGALVIPSGVFESQLIQAHKMYLGVLKALEVQPPFVLFLSMLQMKGVKYAVKAMRMQFSRHSKFDRESVLLPEALMEESAMSADTALRPILDAVWNAAGHERCFNYDENGRWRPEP